MAKKFKACLINGCNRNAHYSAGGYRGWCRRHYARWLNHGDPLGGRQTFNGDPEKFLRETAFTYTGDDCLVWPYARNKLGRGQIRLNKKTVEVGRLVCEAKNGPPPTPEHEAAHNCGNGHLGCVNPNHMRWDTTVGNQRDRVKHGTSNRGEQSGNVKLTADKVRQIRSLIGKKTHPEIAAMFDIAAPTVSMIHNRRSWAWLDA